MIIRSNLKCLCKVGGVFHLAPGVNTIRDDIAAEIVKTEDYKSKVKNKILIVIKDIDPKAAKEEAEKDRTSPLANVTVPKAVEAIEGMNDVNQLQILVDTDPRAGVTKAAQLRIDQIRKELEADAEAAKAKGAGAGLQ